MWVETVSNPTTLKDKLDEKVSSDVTQVQQRHARGLWHAESKDCRDWCAEGAYREDRIHWLLLYQGQWASPRRQVSHPLITWFGAPINDASIHKRRLAHRLKFTNGPSLNAQLVLFIARILMFILTTFRQLISWKDQSYSTIVIGIKFRLKWR